MKRAVKTGNHIDLMNSHFTYVTGIMSAYACNHCGGLVTLQTWQLHLVACPALAKWNRENNPPEQAPDEIGQS